VEWLARLAGLTECNLLSRDWWLSFLARRRRGSPWGRGTAGEKGWVWRFGSCFLSGLGLWVVAVAAVAAGLPQRIEPCHW
jgi:hypothetical protein